MTCTIIRGDAAHLPLEDDSVDLIVTSPPYFGLRSYQDGGEHYEGQIGDEATPAEFVAALIACTREWMRVLKPSGSLWVNLGDKYSSHQGAQGATGARATRAQAQTYTHRPAVVGAPTKSLIGIPWRYALACIDDLGLILRAEVVWSKPNGLPESVTDRVRRSHEQWFYFEQSRGDVVEPGAQRLPLCPLCGCPPDPRASLVARLHELDTRVEDFDLSDQEGPDQRVERERGLRSDQPTMVGLNRTSVPFAIPGDADLVENAADFLDDRKIAVVDHDSQVGAARATVTQCDASLPVDDASKPRDVCRCSHPFIIHDEPWIPQTLAADLMQMVADGEADAQSVADFLSGDYARTHSTWFHFTMQPRYYSNVDAVREAYTAPPAKAQTSRATLTGAHRNPTTLLDHDLEHNPLGKLPGSVWTIPTQPLTVPDHLGVDHFAAFPMEWPRRIIRGWSPPGAVVLDPFGGTGTTALVASVEGRHGISNDMSADYCRLAQWRTTDPGERARAAHRPKPTPVPDGQGVLL